MTPAEQIRATMAVLEGINTAVTFDAASLADRLIQFFEQHDQPYNGHYVRELAQVVADHFEQGLAQHPDYEHDNLSPF